MIPKYRAWEPDTKFMQTVIVFVKPVILEGGLLIEEFTFDRWCKCGWKIHIDLREDGE